MHFDAVAQAITLRHGYPSELPGLRLLHATALYLLATGCLAGARQRHLRRLESFHLSDADSLRGVGAGHIHLVTDG
jgi:hypothetical protein